MFDRIGYYVLRPINSLLRAILHLPDPVFRAIILLVTMVVLGWPLLLHKNIYTIVLSVLYYIGLSYFVYRLFKSIDL